MKPCICMLIGLCMCACSPVCFCVEWAQKNVSVRLWTLIKMIFQCIISWPYGQHGGGISPHLQVIEFENSPTIIKYSKQRAGFIGLILEKQENLQAKIFQKVSLDVNKRTVAWLTDHEKLCQTRVRCLSFLSGSDPSSTVLLYDLWNVAHITMVMSPRALLLLFTADAFQIYRKVSSKAPFPGSDLDTEMFSAKL